MARPFEGEKMFDIDEFTSDCRASAQDGGPIAVKEYLAATMGQRSRLLEVFGTADRASLTVLYSGPDLTILNAVWAPKMVFPPHDHRTWGVIGIYGGEEDNLFFRRAEGTLERTGSHQVREGDVVALGDDVIHLVTNPSQHGFTGGIHVYGGDYLNNPRSIWDEESLTEGPATFAQSQAIFDRANEGLPAAK